MSFARFGGWSGKAADVGDALRNKRQRQYQVGTECIERENSDQLRSIQAESMSARESEGTSAATLGQTVCPKCDAPFVATANFCGECGTSRVRSSSSNDTAPIALFDPRIMVVDDKPPMETDNNSSSAMLDNKIPEQTLGVKTIPILDKLLRVVGQTSSDRGARTESTEAASRGCKPPKLTNYERDSLQPMAKRRMVREDDQEKTPVQPGEIPPPYIFDKWIRRLEQEQNRHAPDSSVRRWNMVLRSVIHRKGYAQWQQEIDTCYGGA